MSAAEEEPAPPPAAAAGTAESPAPPRWVVHALLGLLCTIWGTTYFVIRTGLEDLPPFTGASVRFFVAAACMAALAPAIARREGGGAPSLRLTLCVGLLNIGVGYSLVYWSETVLPSGLVSVLWAVFPMMMALTGHLFLPGERLGGTQWLGFLVGFLGVAALFLTDLARIGPEALPAGALLLLSPAANALGNAGVRRWGRATSSAKLNRNAMLLGALVIGALALATERGEPVRWTPAAIGSVAYLALVGTVTAFGVFYWLLRHAPAYELSLIAYVIPAVALFVGAVAGGEPVHGTTLGGGALILGGVALVHLGRRRGARPAPGPK